MPGPLDVNLYKNEQKQTINNPLNRQTSKGPIRMATFLLCLFIIALHCIIIALFVCLFLHKSTSNKVGMNCVRIMPIHRLTLLKGVYSLRYFLSPMHIPNLLMHVFISRLGIRIGDRKYLNEYTPFGCVSL